MSLTANIYPTNYVMANNPVKLSIASSSPVTYVVSSSGTTLFEGSGEGTFFVFLQEILQKAVQAATVHNESSAILIDCSTSIANISIVVTNADNETTTLTVKAVAGGVSKRALRLLADENSTIFTWKLLNATANFFRSTRSSNDVIYIKETEILPIPFLYPDGAIKVVAGGVETSLNGTLGQAYALNLYQLRKTIFENTGNLPAVFEIYCGTTKSCTIVITESAVTRERYLLEFVNSLGGYERMEVTGIGSRKFEADADTETYTVYDEVVDDYIECRDRRKNRETFIVDSGYKSTDNFSFLLDMISSSDVKILGLSGRNIKVIPTADNLVQAAQSIEPISIKLSLRFAEAEDNYTGELNSFASSDEDNRIHTTQFNDIFN